jgi:hypothetical protein
MQVKTTKMKTTRLSVVVIKWEAMTTPNLNKMTKIRKKKRTTQCVSHPRYLHFRLAFLTAHHVQMPDSRAGTAR